MLLNFISLISSGTELFQNLGRNWSTDQKNWIAFTKLWREASNICSSFNYFWDTFGIRLLHLLEIFCCYLSTDPKTFVCSSLCCNRINVHLNCVFVFVSSKSHHFHMTESSFWENWSLCIINIVQMLTVQFFHLLKFFLVFVLMFFDMWNSFLFLLGVLLSELELQKEEKVFILWTSHKLRFVLSLILSYYFVEQLEEYLKKINFQEVENLVTKYSKRRTSAIFGMPSSLGTPSRPIMNFPPSQFPSSATSTPLRYFLF